MPTDWGVYIQIIVPIITAIIGAGLHYYLEGRPKLVAYFSNVSTFKIKPDGGKEFPVNTHSIVIRNTGKKPANNVRVCHDVLPRDYNIIPVVKYNIEELDGAAREIVFPIVRPDEQITIAYLYPLPLNFKQINTKVKSDNGLAKIINVLQAPRYPKWIAVVLWILLIFGLATVIYILFELMSWLVTHL